MNSRVGWTRAELDAAHLFHGVDLDTVEPLLADCAVQVLAADEVLITAGEENHHLYLVLTGRLSVYLRDDDDEPVAAVEAGESVGEISLIDRQPTSASVKAAEETRVLALDEQLLWLLADTSHGVSTNMLFTLARRIRYGNRVIAHNRELLAELEFRATVDPLTSLFNRYWLQTMLPRQIERCRKDGDPLTVMMVDIDHFKTYNDDHGHLAGDCVLQQVAACLRESLRPSDMIGRFGGEEFIVLMPRTGLTAARPAAERVRRSVGWRRMLSVAGTALPRVSVSIGIAEFAAGESPEAIVERADAALYRAKEAGRDRVME